MAEVFWLNFSSILSSSTSTFLPGCEKTEAGKDGGQYLFYSATALPPSLFLEMHPGFFLWVTRQQTHHFVSILSLRAETVHRGSSGEAQQRPTWLTYQWRARHILWARSVTHNWSWQQSRPLPTTREEQRLLGLRDMEKLQLQGSLCVCVCLSLTLSVYFLVFIFFLNAQTYTLISINSKALS